MSCALEDCGDPECPVYSIARKPQRFDALNPPWDLRKDAKALNGTKPRPTRDPRLIKRQRKPLTR